MIRFGLMHVEGFGPIKSEVFDWGLVGLNIIQAPNGYGKTKFINALCWGLYGKTLSGSVETWDFVRGKNHKGTKVEVNFDTDKHSVQVIRCKDYRGLVNGAKGKNRLVLSIDGVESNTKEKRDLQVELEGVLGYSEDLFKNSIIFGQKLKRLIAETGPNKKKVFDEAFEVVYISKARELAETDYKAWDLEYQKQLVKVDGLIKDRNNTQEKLNREKEVVKNFETNKQANISEQEKYIAEAYAKIENLTVDYAAIDLSTTELFQEQKKKLEKLGTEKFLSGNVARLELRIQQTTNEIDKIDTQIESIPLACSRCGKIYTDSERRQEKVRLKEERIKFKNLIVELKGSLSDANGAYSSHLKLKKEVESLEATLKKLEGMNREISQLEKDIENHKNTIKILKGQTLQNNCEEYTRILSAGDKVLKQEKIMLLNLHKKVKVHNWLITDPLSNKGLKAYVFETMLESLNDKLSEYSQFIGFQVLFDIDMESHNKDLVTFIYNGSNIVPYEDLSGGQKQAVDVVSAFAIHDVVNEGRECNLLVLDEVFESLDKNNIEIVTELIQDKARNKALYLVTHIDGFVPTNSHIIKIHFKDGVTSLAE